MTEQQVISYLEIIRLNTGFRDTLVTTGTSPLPLNVYLNEEQDLEMVSSATTIAHALWLELSDDSGPHITPFEEAKQQAFSAFALHLDALLGEYYHRNEPR